MSRRHLTAALLSAALLSACGTGLEAQTYQGRTPHESTSGEVGDLAIRNLAVEAPGSEGGIAKGEDAVVTGVVTNQGTEADELTGASSDVAATVTIQPGTAVAPSGAASMAAPGAEPIFGGGTVSIPAGGTSGTTWKLVLTGVTRDLRPGQFVSVTLEFAKAGRTTLQIPVRTGDNGLEDRDEARDPYHVGE